MLIIRYRKNLRKLNFFAKTFDLIKGVINGLKTITKLDRKWEFIGHTVFIWLNYALMTWVVVFAIESTSDITFLQSFFILVIGSLAMSAPVQGGIGAFHYFVSRGLAVVHGVNSKTVLSMPCLPMNHRSSLSLLSNHLFLHSSAEGSAEIQRLIERIPQIKSSQFFILGIKLLFIE